jgi:hypothetical protein
VKCTHEGFHTITSSYDRETRVITYYRRCDDCGAQLSEFGRLAYEPRFVATQTNEHWTLDWSIGRAPKSSRDVPTLERPPKGSRTPEFGAPAAGG